MSYMFLQRERPDTTDCLLQIRVTEIHLHYADSIRETAIVPYINSQKRLSCTGRGLPFKGDLP